MTVPPALRASAARTATAPIAAGLALALVVLGWWWPWTGYPEGLGGGTQAWLLGRRQTGLVLTMAVSSVLTVVGAALTVRHGRARRIALVVSGVALASAATAVLVVDLGMVTWTGRSDDGRWTGGAAAIERGPGLVVLVLAPAIALVGAAAVEAWARSVRNPTGRTPGPTTPPAG